MSGWVNTKTEIVTVVETERADIHTSFEELGLELSLEIIPTDKGLYNGVGEFFPISEDSTIDICFVMGKTLDETKDATVRAVLRAFETALQKFGGLVGLDVSVDFWKTEARN